MCNCVDCKKEHRKAFKKETLASNEINCDSISDSQLNEIANLISKLNFYKLIPYPMDNSLSGRRGPARQTSEKDVLCLHRLSRPSTVHSSDGVSYFLPV